MFLIQDLGVFCEECGAHTPGPTAESCYCCTAPFDPSATQRNCCYHPLPHPGQKVMHREINLQFTTY